MKTQIVLTLETDELLPRNALLEMVRATADVFLRRHGMGKVTKFSCNDPEEPEPPSAEPIPRIEGFSDEFGAFVCTIEVQKWGASYMASCGHGFPQVYGSGPAEAIRLMAQKIAVLIGMTGTELTYQPDGKALARFERDPQN